MKTLYRLLGFDPRRHSLRSEVLSGLTTFLVMVYILALAPANLTPIVPGVTEGQIFTATTLACAFGSILMAFIGRVPIAIGPAVGAIFLAVNSVSDRMDYSYSFILTAVFLEGLIFLFMTFTGLRRAIVESLSENMKSAIALGIGLFIASLGFKSCGLFDGDGLFGLLDTIIQPEKQLFCIGILITGVLLMRRVPGAMFLGIILTALIGIPMDVTHVTSFISMPEMPPLFMLDLSLDNLMSIDMFVLVVSLLFLDIFDTTGSAIGVMTVSGHVRPTGRIPELTGVFVADSLSTMVGSCVGVTTCTSYVESAAGAAEGGKSGMSALVVGICFLLSIFFSPLFLAIPGVATAPVLVLVGAIIFVSRRIVTDTPLDYVPCFLTVIVMPLAGSIFDGIVLGLIVYAFLNAAHALIHGDPLKEKIKRKMRIGD